MVLDRGEVDARRGRSRASSSGPCVTDYKAMALKTAVLALRNWIPFDGPTRSIIAQLDREELDYQKPAQASAAFAASLMETVAPAPKSRPALTAPPHPLVDFSAFAAHPEAEREIREVAPTVRGVRAQQPAKQEPMPEEDHDDSPIARLAQASEPTAGTMFGLPSDEPPMDPEPRSRGRR